MEDNYIVFSSISSSLLLLLIIYLLIYVAISQIFCMLLYVLRSSIPSLPTTGRSSSSPNYLFFFFSLHSIYAIDYSLYSPFLKISGCFFNLKFFQKFFRFLNDFYFFFLLFFRHFFTSLIGRFPDFVCCN